MVTNTQSNKITASTDKETFDLKIGNSIKSIQSLILAKNEDIFHLKILVNRENIIFKVKTFSNTIKKFWKIKKS